MLASVLIVDDEQSIVQSLSGLLSDEGFEVSTAVNGFDALKAIELGSPDLVLLDIWMPGMDGIETLKEIKKFNPQIQVIIITGHGTIETAVKATKLGAFDLVEKPLSIDKIILSINNALNFRRLEEENRYLRKKTLAKNSIDGNSPGVLALKQKIAAVASTDTWVLITGENGTGKELVARALYQFSKRADGPFLAVNCAAIPESWLESELFGHKRGAFTGASEDRVGLFELADGGTLFLDEIGEISPAFQVKLLRVLQEGEIKAVGAEKSRKIDVRIIAATNRNLEEEVRKGRFRDDLWYRLNVFPITMPPLRDRMEDIPLLVDFYIKKISKRLGKTIEVIPVGVMTTLQNYHWPGNVRELENVLERAVINSSGPKLHLVDELKAPSKELTEANRSLADVERAYIVRVLEQTHWKVSGKNSAAEILGLNRSTLRARMRKHAAIITSRNSQPEVMGRPAMFWAMMTPKGLVPAQAQPMP